MSTLRELVTKWRGVTVGESNHGSLRPLTATEADVAHICADQLAAALVAEGRGTPDFALPEQRDLTPVEQAALRRVYAKLYKPVAAVPSPHKEGAGGAVNELRALAEQFSIKGHAVIANPDRARAYEECSGSLINLAQKLSRAAETESAPLPLQRTLPDEQFKGVVVEAIEGERTQGELGQELSDSIGAYAVALARRQDGESADDEEIGAAIKRCVAAKRAWDASPAGRAEQP